MTPLYFGDSTRQLFGIYHEARSRARRDTGVLLCHPLGKEYMRCHWAFRQLAAELTRAGFHVFRFDYHGTGDSAGESGEGDAMSWCEDIVTAAQELQDTAGTRRLVLVGLRLGAALAALASVQLHPAELVLWDPVIDGQRYLDQIRNIHRQLLESRSYFFRPRVDGGGEILGFYCPTPMDQSIAAIDLLHHEIVAERLHLFVSQPDVLSEQLRRHLIREHGASLAYHLIEPPGEWDDLDQIEHALLVGELPRLISESLTR